MVAPPARDPAPRLLWAARPIPTSCPPRAEGGRRHAHCCQGWARRWTPQLREVASPFSRVGRLFPTAACRRPAAALLVPVAASVVREVIRWRIEGLVDDTQPARVTTLPPVRNSVRRARRGACVASPYFVDSGFQFCSNVIGASALSSSVLMRKRGRHRNVVAWRGSFGDWLCRLYAQVEPDEHHLPLASPGVNISSTLPGMPP